MKCIYAGCCAFREFRRSKTCVAIQKRKSGKKKKNGRKKRKRRSGEIMAKKKGKKKGNGRQK
jgi:hypothetical protein